MGGCAHRSNQTRFVVFYLITHNTYISTSHFNARDHFEFRDCQRVTTRKRAFVLCGKEQVLGARGAPAALAIARGRCTRGCMCCATRSTFLVRDAPPAALALARPPPPCVSLRSGGGADPSFELGAPGSRSGESVRFVRRGAPAPRWRSSLPPRLWGLSSKLIYSVVVHEQERSWPLLADPERISELG